MGIVLPILIAGIITTCILIFKKPKIPINPDDPNPNDSNPDDPNPDEQNTNEPNDPFSVITSKYEKGNKKLESEFEFNTKVGDLKRIMLIKNIKKIDYMKVKK